MWLESRGIHRYIQQIYNAHVLQWEINSKCGIQCCTYRCNNKTVLWQYLNQNNMQLYINFWCNFGSKHVWTRLILVTDWLSDCLSVTLVDQDHIGWKSWKLTQCYFEKHVKFKKNQNIGQGLLCLHLSGFANGTVTCDIHTVHIITDQM